MHETRAIGRVKPQAGGGGFVQRKAQDLPFLADNAESGDFVGLGVAVFSIRAHIKLRREQRLHGQQGCCRIDSVRTGKIRRGVGQWLGNHDELVGQRIGQGQQVACDSRRQSVEGDAKLGRRKLTDDGLDVPDGPSAGVQKAQQRLSGEETHMGFVQQPF